jgi:hypothetical protein
MRLRSLPKPYPIAPSRLLEVLLVFSAGLCRTWKRSAVVDAYPSLLDFQQTYRALDQQLLGSNDAPAVANVDRLAALLGRYSPQDLIIATAHHSHFIAFLNACARYGIPLAACYKAAAQSYLDASERNGLKLVDLSSGNGVPSLFRTLDRQRAEGRYVVIMMDGPFASRRRYGFLGYCIAASCLASLYARKTHSGLLPLICSVSPSLQLSYTAGPVIDGVRTDVTQCLLDFLQPILLREYPQYQWLSNSVLMSDQEARDNALGFLREALEWRAAHTSSHFMMPPPLASLLSVTRSS